MLMRQSDNITIRQLTPADVSDEWLSWLNDSELQKYTRRRTRVTTLDDLKSLDFTGNDLYFAILVDQLGHIGNIFLNKVDYLNRNADLSIMIGNKKAHGKGYAKKAIELVTHIAFNDLGLKKLYAGSCNPDFNVLIQKLGWKKEGLLSKHCFIDGEFIDVTLWGIINE